MISRIFLLGSQVGQQTVFQCCSKPNSSTPGPEVAEQLSIYQQNLRDKTQKMKAMASELNMYVPVVWLVACLRCYDAYVVCDV